MAKGLRIGDAVTVRTERRLPRNDPAYRQGLKRLRPGEFGQVVGAAEGRSVVVEFDGKRVTLSSQRLDRVVRPGLSLLEYWHHHQRDGPGIRVIRQPGNHV